MASKLDGDPGALMGVVEVAPGGVTDTAIWMFGELNVTVAVAVLFPLAAELSKLLAALDASAVVTLLTCARAAGLLADALLAMVDKAFTTEPPVDPDTLSDAVATEESTLNAVDCVAALIDELPLTTASTLAATVEATFPLRLLALDDTDASTESAAVCTAGDRLALDEAETTARTREAAVLAAAPVSAVPLPCDDPLASPDRRLVCAAARAEPVAPVSCAVTDSTAADTLVPAAVRFTGGAGGRATSATAKLLSTLTLTPVTPAVESAVLKLDAKLAGLVLARPVDTDEAAAALVTATVNGTTSDVDSSSRRDVTRAMPDVFTFTALGGTLSDAAVTLTKAAATGPLN